LFYERYGIYCLFCQESHCAPWRELIPVQSYSLYFYASGHITNNFQQLLEFLWRANCVKLTPSTFLREDFNFSISYLKRLDLDQVHDVSVSVRSENRFSECLAILPSIFTYYCLRNYIMTSRVLKFICLVLAMNMLKRHLPVP
jgi:hypothetical protein